MVVAHSARKRSCRGDVLCLGSSHGWRYNNDHYNYNNDHNYNDDDDNHDRCANHNNHHYNGPTHHNDDHCRTHHNIYNDHYFDNINNHDNYNNDARVVYNHQPVSDNGGTCKDVHHSGKPGCVESGGFCGVKYLVAHRVRHAELHDHGGANDKFVNNFHIGSITSTSFRISCFVSWQQSNCCGRWKAPSG